MSVVFFAGLPRSSTLGFADLFYQTIEDQSKNPLMTGHLHLAAALLDYDLSNFDSPLNLYKSQEALMRCMLNLHGMNFSPDCFMSMLQYYSSSSPGRINSALLKESIENSSHIIIDPSFSHSLYPNYLLELVDIVVDLYLVVIWRNPISFCFDIMNGVYAFDSCMHWMLAKSNIKFPLDPLSLWLEFVNPFLQISSILPSSFVKTYYLHSESIFENRFSELSNEFSCSSGSIINRFSALDRIDALLTDCPFSGDPSYYVQNNTDTPFLVSIDQLSRFSSSESVVAEAVTISEAIGYTLVE